MFEIHADPLTVAAIAKARAAQGRAIVRWSKIRAIVDDSVDDETREALADHSVEALRHLDEGRFDEARACAELVMDGAESLGHGSLWREFGLLVEEAAETGFAAQREDE